MRYHYEEPSISAQAFGEIYECNHLLYNACTLFKIQDKGLAIIQQRFDEKTKTASWGPIDSCYANAIYIDPGFKKYFDTMSGEIRNGLYPTVSLRQIMWALRMKPPKKHLWETYFDRTRF